MNKPYYVSSISQEWGVFSFEVFKPNGKHSSFNYFFSKEEADDFVRGWELEYFYHICRTVRHNTECF